MNTKPYVILVGIDFSELADRALDEALLLASKQADAEVHVLAVLPVPTLDARYAIPAYAFLDEPESLAKAIERLRTHLQIHFEKFGLKHPQAAFPPRVVSHVNIGNPAHAIAQLASDLAADIIVVGTHNRRGVERMLLGSVAEGTVRYAHCPVLVIPAEQPHDEVKITPPCSECVRARRDSAGEQLWCAQHREHHGRRHTYHQSDRSGAESNFPLVNR
ncbi:MAG TPA: universal stress protein [Polyangiaceae bacterium]